MSRNPADFNRSFFINEKKKHTRDDIRYGVGRFVGSEYCEAWARYRVGEGDRERACHVTRRGWESHF